MENVKVLLIGNSQMGCYQLPEMLNNMSCSADASHPSFDIDTCIAGGMTLKKFWEKEDTENNPRKMIVAGKYDYVVIQEIYSAAKSDFSEYAGKFAGLVKESKAEPVLLATASISKYYGNGSFSFPESTLVLNKMQIEFGRENNVAVLAGGNAWLEYLGDNFVEEDYLDLYHDDKGHPGAKGTYIYACLVYAYLTRCNPDGLCREFSEIREGIKISENDAKKIQDIAWREYLKYAAK